MSLVVPNTSKDLAFSASNVIQVMTDTPERAEDAVDLDTASSRRGIRFYLIFTSMCISLFLSALEASSVSTALPTIANALHASQFTWVGAAYFLSSTAFLPMSGGLAQTIGRRHTVLIALGFFSLGSGICGGATTMSMLIAGRSIQGFGGGGIQSLTGIVLADFVGLQERGVYNSFYSVTWGIAASIGPLIGGKLATQGQWRWLFYLNLPICFVACLLVIFLLDLPVPPGGYREKLLRMDWIGNLLVVLSTAACTIGLTFGGIAFPWSSAAVLDPLVLGVIILGVFFAYEAILAEHPLVPFSLMTNVTSISGYIQTFCVMIVTTASVYYFPIYFQACKGVSAVESGIYSLGFAALAPAMIATGFSVKFSGRYRPQMWLGWVLIMIALGLMSTISVTDHIGEAIGYTTLSGLGIGILSATSMFPIQAPLPVTQNARVLAFSWFLRSFASVWGITIGIMVLQSELSRRLPESFLRSDPQGVALAYALIPELFDLAPDARVEIQAAFAGSLSVLWRVLGLVSAVGFLASLFMKGLTLQNELDANWALRDRRGDTLDA